MSLDDLDAKLNSPKRLAAMGILAAARKVEFGYLRDQLQLTDSDLSKQLKVLLDAGYATTKRTGKGTSRASWFSITTEGSAALDQHANALQRLLQHQIATTPAADVPTAEANLAPEHA